MSKPKERTSCIDAYGKWIHLGEVVCSVTTIPELMNVCGTIVKILPHSDDKFSTTIIADGDVEVTADSRNFISQSLYTRLASYERISLCFYGQYSKYPNKFSFGSLSDKELEIRDDVASASLMVNHVTANGTPLIRDLFFFTTRPDIRIYSYPRKLGVVYCVGTSPASSQIFTTDKLRFFESHEEMANFIKWLVAFISENKPSTCSFLVPFERNDTQKEFERRLLAAIEKYPA